MDGIRYINLEYFFNKIAEVFIEGGLPSTATGSVFAKIGMFFTVLVRFILPLLIVVLIIAYFYYLFRVHDIERLEKNRTYERIDRTQKQFYKDTRNSRWDRVVELFASTVPADWRIAVIEADAMLDSLFSSLGYEGDTLGEKMKDVDPGHFPTIQDAWEAHKVRNRIAHDGMDFQLDEVEKNRVFKLYEKVFSDAGYI